MTSLNHTQPWHAARGCNDPKEEGGDSSKPSTQTPKERGIQAKKHRASKNGLTPTETLIKTLLVILFLSLANVALAAGDAPAYFSEVAILIVASALIAYGCFRLGLVPIVGFLIAGVLLNLTGLVTDMELIDAVAEIGVILLLFTIGIEFSLDNLMRIQRLIFVGGGLQVGLTIALVTGLGLLFGVDARAAVFTGMLLALSSTAIVMKLLANRNETNEPPGRVVAGHPHFSGFGGRGNGHPRAHFGRRGRVSGRRGRVAGQRGAHHRRHSRSRTAGDA